MTTKVIYVENVPEHDWHDVASLRCVLESARHEIVRNSLQARKIDQTLERLHWDIDGTEPYPD